MQGKERGGSIVHLQAQVQFSIASVCDLSSYFNTVTTV